MRRRFANKIVLGGGPVTTLARLGNIEDCGNDRQRPVGSFGRRRYAGCAPDQQAERARKGRQDISRDRNGEMTFGLVWPHAGKDIKVYSGLHLIQGRSPRCSSAEVNSTAFPWTGCRDAGIPLISKAMDEEGPPVTGGGSSPELYSCDRVSYSDCRSPYSDGRSPARGKALYFQRKALYF